MSHSAHTSHIDLISREAAPTIPGVFRMRVSRTPDAVAYRQFDREHGVWQSYTWRSMEGRVANWQSALDAEDLEPGDRVAIALPNCSEWVCFDQAALSRGLIVVPLYTMDTPENVAYILADSGASLLLVDRPEQWQALAPYRESLSNLKRVVSLATPGREEAEDSLLRPVSDWLPVAPAWVPHRREASC